MFREWYTHPNGQLPAYEWDFSDVNPPVHAWAALAVFRIDGGEDFDFLARVFHKLLINFTWWVNRKDALGDNVFEGGFLGLDNIGPFDRSAGLPGGEVLEQSDGTAWMAKYCLNMLEMALRLANHDRSYEDIAVKFFEHFASIAPAMNELWDEEDGFFYDRLRKPDGETMVVRARSAVGLLPVFASVQLPTSLWERLPNFRERARWFIDNMPPPHGVRALFHAGRTHGADLSRRRAAVSSACWRACSTRTSFFRPTACARCRASIATIRSSSISAGPTTRLDYEPAEFDHAPVRRQLELARAGLVSPQPSRGRVASRVASACSARLHHRAADRFRKARCISARRRTKSSAG